MVEPTNDVVAIVVDMRNASSNSVYIHEINDDYVDMVGLDFRGYVVIVPWEPGLKFMCYGSCKVGEVYESIQENGSQGVDQ